MENNKINMVQVVPDSQYYVSIEQIKLNVENLKYRLDCQDKGIGEDFLDNKILYTTSLEEEINHLIKGLENTSKKYKMVDKNAGDAAATSSTLQKDINRISKKATQQYVKNKSRKTQITQFSNLITDLIKSGRITKQEVAKYIKKK